MGGTPASFGYWVRRRRLALDLTQAALARRVGCSTAAVKKIEHDERRPSRTMADRLAGALGLPPDLYDRFVAAAVGELPPDRLQSAGDPSDAGPAPAWLSTAPAEPQRVVGRDAELARLEAHLGAVLDGHGRVVFVTGESGQGKTALLAAFAARAQQVAPDLVVARGAGTVAGGYGDPYLAWRDVFRMLVADPRTPWQADQLTAAHAANLWAFAPEVARAAVATGPHLLDVLIPGDTVSERLGTTFETTTPPSSRDHVVTEVTDLLRALSERRPLLVLLDDVQWADAASAELVFHLGRRLAGARVLIVCAYRGSEVAGDGGSAMTALKRAVAENARDLDDPRLELDRGDATADRALCDALLDLELPDLDRVSRDEIFGRTRGHPLFVQELVRELKARGDLERRHDGSWSARAGMDWTRVPSKVAAIVEQRLDRVGADERALLEAAAVEGEQFTAEFAASVAGVDEATARRLYARELTQLQGLVLESGSSRIGDRSITTYRFHHVLFQQFLYSTLSDGQRRAAHARLASELEAVHGDDVGDLAPQLAHHWAEAGDGARATPYLIQAGDRARVLQAHDDAMAAYERAIGFLREAGDRERLARTLMKVGLTHESVFDHDRAQRSFDDAFGMWSEVDAASQGVSRLATLRMLWREPETLDPTMGGYVLAAPMVTNLLSGLVRYDEGTNVVPDVARRWEISADGRRYTFHLRDDVTWTDGRPVTAHDFVYTYRRALDPATDGTGAAPALLEPVVGAREARSGAIPAEAVGVRALDDRTLVIELTEPTSYFIYNLAYYCMLPVPRQAVEAHGPSWWTSPETMVSNGPFRLVEWEHGRTLVVERNDAYHGASAGNVRRVTLRLDVPTAEQAALYLADEVDLLSTELGVTDSATINRLRARLPSEYSRREAFMTFSAHPDHAVPPLGDRRVRQAMAMAIDRHAVVASLDAGLSRPATGGLVPPGMPGHVPGAAAPHDPARAARLVAEAARGGDLPQIIVVALRIKESAARLVAEAWTSIGLDVRTEIFDVAADVFERLKAVSEPTVLLGGWIADYPDPDTFLRVMIVGDETWHHPRYHRLLEQAARTQDSAARLAAYEEAERILAEEAVAIPVTYESSHLLLKPWVRSYPSVPVKYPGFWKDIVIGADDPA